MNQLGAQRRRLAEFAERQRDELANEIQLAAEVQQGILPRSVPRVPGFDCAARMYPAKTVAGDYYGFIELPAGEIAVVIADVSGKGVAAGLLMPSIEVALRLDAPRLPRTSDLLHTFNNVVCQVTGGHRFCFMLVPTQVPWTKEVRCWVCCPIRTTRVTRSIYAKETFWFCTLTGQSRLRIQQENNTPTRLAKIVSAYPEQSANELVETIYRSITKFRGTRLLADDLTLVVSKTC